MAHSSSSNSYVHTFTGVFHTNCRVCTGTIDYYVLVSLIITTFNILLRMDSFICASTCTRSRLILVWNLCNRAEDASFSEAYSEICSDVMLATFTKMRNLCSFFYHFTTYKQYVSHHQQDCIGTCAANSSSTGNGTYHFQYNVHRLEVLWE